MKQQFLNIISLIIFVADSLTVMVMLHDVVVSQSLTLQRFWHLLQNLMCYKLHVMLISGWGGKGLGASEQGIVDPIAGGDVRDRQDMFKGVGVDLRDPFEQFRKNKSHGFIARMKARDEMREKSTKGITFFNGQVLCLKYIVYCRWLYKCVRHLGKNLSKHTLQKCLFNFFFSGKKDKEQETWLMAA